MNSLEIRWHIDRDISIDSHAYDNDLLYDGCLAIVQSSLEGFRDLKFDIISIMLNSL